MSPVKSCPEIPIPILKGDQFRCSTVLPYLESFHYDFERDSEEMYYTERDLNRKL